MPYQRFLLLGLLSLFVASLGCDSGGGSTLPDLAKLSFKADRSTLIGNVQSTEKAARIPGCSGEIHPDDSLGQVAVVSVFSKTRCYTDEARTHGDYKVERGTLRSSNGRIDTIAYRVHEPERKATESLGSPHAIYFKFASAEDHTVYEWIDDTLREVAFVSGKSIDTGEFIRVSGLNASDIVGVRTFAFVPGKLSGNRLTSLGEGVEGARVRQTAVGDVLLYRFSVDGRPFDTTRDYTAGPASHENQYGQNRQFFFVGPKSDGAHGLVWQDKASGELTLSWLSKGRRSITHVALAGGKKSMVLAAVASGPQALYYLLAETGDGEPTSSRALELRKADLEGKPLETQVLSAEDQEDAFNCVEFAESLLRNSNSATMRVHGNHLGLMFARKMHPHTDGLNHQSGVAAVFDTETLSLIKHHGPTASHSFGNFLTVNAEGRFLGIDLGDGYPRGIGIHKFDEQGLVSRLVYGFKTKHGAGPQNPAGKTFPVYAEASQGGQNAYQWSNDNSTYTELGGVIETVDGYLVVFVGERDPLDYGLVGERHNAPRNIGFVLVREDFENSTRSQSNVVDDDLVLSEGPAETGGFYTFNGEYRPQRNKGVSWLTDYQTMEDNASRLKAARLPGGEILLLWELWSADAYRASYGMRIDGRGNRVSEPVELGPYVRLGSRDELRVESAGGDVLLTSGDAETEQLSLVVIETAR